MSSQGHPSHEVKKVENFGLGWCDALSQFSSATQKMVLNHFLNGQIGQNFECREDAEIPGNSVSMTFSDIQNGNIQPFFQDINFKFCTHKLYNVCGLVKLKLPSPCLRKHCRYFSIIYIYIYIYIYIKPTVK